MAKKRRKKGDADRLGKLRAEYRPGAAALLELALLLLIAGVGLLVWCQFQDPYPWKLMVLGLFLLLLSPVLVAVNAFNFRRSLQVREHGLRFVEAGGERDFTWDE